jgi:hypothetical protein
MTRDLLRRYRFHREHSARSAKHALAYARAERLLDDLLGRDLASVIWAHDEYTDRGPVDWGWGEKEVKRWNLEDHEAEYCQIEDAEGNHLASLSGIWDADANYRRTVEAELALECLEALQEIDRINVDEEVC